jgi:hypothetical protein
LRGRNKFFDALKPSVAAVLLVRIFSGKLAGTNGNRCTARQKPVIIKNNNKDAYKVAERTGGAS